jgi:hypothetical protein
MTDEDTKWQQERRERRRWTTAELKKLEPWLLRMRETTQRAEGLVDLASDVRSFEYEGYPNAHEKAEDILRVAVVFVHAYLEDFLRTVAGRLLPSGDESRLNDVPLAESGSSGRGEKFLLGQLAKHKGKTVDEVLHQSVSEHLERSSYNSTREIAMLLEKLGFNVSDHNKDFSVIEAMIARRHQIVHRADRVKAPHSDIYSLQPINADQVHNWLGATLKFTSSLVTPLARKLNEPNDPEASPKKSRRRQSG